ncbi:MAG: hypothetical protein AAF125_27315, partial [Chloroflexota bacterium]
MRRFTLWIIALLCLGAVMMLRRNAEALQFVVPTNRDLLYATTFSDGQFTTDWSTEDRRGYVSDISNGQLQLTIEEAVFLAERSPNAIRATNRYRFGDFDYRVRTTALEGPENNSFGIVFRQVSPDTYYIFYISSDGYYSIWRETPAGRIALSAWIPTDVINQGTDNITNDIRVVGTGNTFSFYANGEQLRVCVPDDPSGESTYVESTEECVGG